ncbi:T-complex protein 11-domain-containing protein [Tricladium varicosporioides]|nr:T-complex protein 11-domain-containing protein [Hymenoscyphus varicosporioides]
MEQDSGRKRENSVVRPSPTNNNGGAISNSQVEKSRAPVDGSTSNTRTTTPEPEINHRGEDILADTQEQVYGIQSQKNQQFADSPPRDDRLFPANPSTATERHSRPNTALEPPVTKGTLSELDVNKIVHNPKLRHDINFDPDLHFRPNLDGDKGRRKTQKANHFWETMRNQLREYIMNRDQFEAHLGDTEWSLPATLKAIKGILETLVPQRDRASVEETFNVDLLMQQFRKGVADLVKLANWLSQLLKCHCAPMRDDWVDEMVMQLSNGDRNGDVVMLVAGMQNLLGVLEAMKLDVANHQIRCLRPLLIEDTVHFEQKFFMKKIACRRVDVARAHAWYKTASSLPDIVPLDASMRSQGNTWDFMKALVKLTLPTSSQQDVPHTFLFDEERLTKLRGDLLDLINLEICMHLYCSLEAQTRQDTRYVRDDTPNMSYTSSPVDRSLSPVDSSMLSSPTIPLPHHFNGRAKSLSQERGHFIRTLTGRQVWVPNVDEDQILSSATSSPRSSPSSTASTPESYPETPFYLSAPASDSTSQARTCFQAILASVSSTDKWKTLSPSIALEILRLTNTPLTRLPHFESHLAFHISNNQSRLYGEAETRVLSQLFPILQKLVAQYTPLTSLQIFEAATGPKNLPGNANVQTAGAKEEVTEVATRIAHIAILHWRVWAPLAYLVDPDAEEEADSSNTRAASMP